MTDATLLDMIKTIIPGYVTGDNITDDTIIGINLANDGVHYFDASTQVMNIFANGIVEIKYIEPFTTTYPTDIYIFADNITGFSLKRA
jgi:hypothetical protein